MEMANRESDKSNYLLLPSKPMKSSQNANSSSHGSTAASTPHLSSTYTPPPKSHRKTVLAKLNYVEEFLEATA